MRRVTVWATVWLAVIAAGCGSIADSGGGETTPTITPAPVETPERTATSAPSTVAPGLAPTRIVNSTALVSRHGAVINRSSHVYRKQVTRRYPNGTVWRNYTTVIRRNQSTVHYQYTWTNGKGAKQTVEHWRTDERTYTARIDGNGTTVSVENGTGPNGVTLGTSSGYVATLPGLLDQLNTSVGETALRDDQRLYRLETTEPQRLPPTRNVTFTGYVTPEGVFTDYEFAYRIAQRDVRVDVTVRVAFEDVGSTTVTRPAWANRAVE